MAKIEKLQQEETDKLKITVDTEEVGLEDLITLGESVKIPVHITYPNEDGTTTNARALVKQLKLKEVKDLKASKKQNGYMVSKKVLNKTLYKSNGQKFTGDELDYLPIGVVTALAEEILELSGVDLEKQKQIQDF